MHALNITDEYINSLFPICIKDAKENKNKASLQHVYPNRFDKTTVFNESAFLAVSLGSLAFLNNKFAAIIKLMERFKHYVIYVVDTPYAYTLHIQYGLDIENASRAAKNVGLATIEHQTAVLKNLGMKEPEFILHSIIESEDTYQKLFKALLLEVQDNPSFKLIVNSFSEFYLNRIKEKLFHSHNYAKEVSAHYLLSEISAAGFLNQIGYHSMVYPGKIDSIASILETELDAEVGRMFNGMSYVSLRNCRKKR